MPTTPTFLPGPTCQWRSGEYVVIPAHSSGAALASAVNNKVALSLSPLSLIGIYGK